MECGLLEGCQIGKVARVRCERIQTAQQECPVGTSGCSPASWATRFKVRPTTAALSLLGFVGGQALKQPGLCLGFAHLGQGAYIQNQP